MGIWSLISIHRKDIHRMTERKSWESCVTDKLIFYDNNDFAVGSIELNEWTVILSIHCANIYNVLTILGDHMLSFSANYQRHA